jgi:hypothetical protein
MGSAIAFAAVCSYTGKRRQRGEESIAIIDDSPKCRVGGGFSLV